MRSRIRKIPKEQILHYDKYVCQNPESFKGKWHELFGNTNEVHVEIGTGRGQFLSTLAELNPSVNYIGIEIVELIMMHAVAKADAKELPNIVFLRFDANRLEDIFEENEISRIYLNFSDPWPKKRSIKKRLTYHRFLDMYRDILKPGKEIHFKTDNEKLFEFSLNEFCASDYKLKNITLDLHHSDFEDNVTTEYEDKFSSQGMKIYRCEAISPKK